MDGGLIAGTFAARPRYAPTNQGECAMLWTIAVILLILWVLGLSLKIAGGLIHLLLVIALIVVVVQFLRGRKGV